MRKHDVGKPGETHHCEQDPSVQKAFAKDVKSLISVIEQMGIPFCEDIADLLVLDTEEIVPKCVAEAVSGVKIKGQSICDKYVEERLDKWSTLITGTIQRCNLPLFGTPMKRQSRRTGNQVADLK